MYKSWLLTKKKVLVKGKEEIEESTMCHTISDITRAKGKTETESKVALMRFSI